MGRARALGRLSTLKVPRISDVGRHCDGGGLYLQVGHDGAKSWIFRFQLENRIRDMGLGSLRAVGLADARQFASECRLLLARGIDPIEDRKRTRQARALEAASAVTFEECALALIEAKRASWRNAKHAKQWRRTLETYAFPTLGRLGVGAIDTNLVLKVLEPIWVEKIETAGRVRQRVEAVLDAAKSRGLRSGDNPARWRGHLENLLPKPLKVRKVRNHPALPYLEIAAFMQELRKQEGSSALAMEFLILTAARTSEALGARWDEIDLASRVWTVPADRIKAGKEHRVPLSTPACDLLKRLHEHRVGEHVFCGQRRGKPLSNMALLKLLERMGRKDITTHGFRSTFRDWAAEQTNFPREVAEMALAHAIENKVEAAYRRGGLFEKRAKLMAAWASYCEKMQAPGGVIQLGSGHANAG